MSTLVQLQDDLEALGIYDHQAEATLLYLAATSRKMERKFSILVVGSSAEGKSTLLNTVSRLFPPEDITPLAFLTKAALMREGDLSGKVLLFNEHCPDAALASALRQLISEGQVRYRLMLEGTLQTLCLNGPLVILEATTDSAELDFQNRNRSLVLRINTTPVELAARLERIKSTFMQEGLARAHLAESIWLRHRTIQASLDPKLKVVIPFANQIQFRSILPHSQRFLSNFLCVVQAIAYLDQAARERHPTDSGPYIEATLDDYRVAHHLIRTAKLETGDDLLSDEAAALLLAIRKIPECLGPQPFSRNDILSHTKEWTYKQLRRLLPQLLECGLIESTRGAHNTVRYKLSEMSRHLDRENSLTALWTTLSNPERLTTRGQTAEACPGELANVNREAKAS